MKNLPAALAKGFLLVGILVLLQSCFAPANKEVFLETFENFIETVEKDAEKLKKEPEKPRDSDIQMLDKVLKDLEEK